MVSKEQLRAALEIPEIVPPKRRVQVRGGYSNPSAAGGQRAAETHEPYRNGVSKAWV